MQDTIKNLPTLPIRMAASLLLVGKLGSKYPSNK